MASFSVFATILIHIIIRHTMCLSMYITQEILGRKFIVLTFLANKNLPDKRRDVSCIATLVVGIPYLYLWARFTIQHIKCSGKPIKTHESSLHTPKRMKRFDIFQFSYDLLRKELFWDIQSTAQLGMKNIMF